MPQTLPATKKQEVHGRAAEAMAKAFQHSSVAEELDPEDTKPNSPFFESVDRLGRAFDSFPDEQPAQIVGEINSRLPGSMACPMEWNHSGEPSFVFGGGPPVRLSILGVIDRCASLVEQYRMKTLAQEHRKGS